MYRVLLLVGCALGLLACASSHAEGGSSTEGDNSFSVDGSDGGAPSEAPPPGSIDDGPIATNVEALCGVVPATRGQVAATLSSPDLGDVPVELRVECTRRGSSAGEPPSVALTASGDLYSLAMEADLTDMTAALAAEATLAFESLATFEGPCSLCLDWDGARGTFACPSLVWNEGGEAVKASLSGSFRCP
jgi:hypothetical protein